MSDKIKLVQGDSRPQLQLTLTDDTTGNPIDLTGATVVMKFREAGSDGYLEALTGSITNAAAGVAAGKGGNGAQGAIIIIYSVVVPSNGKMFLMF